jgi:hypothetical protein
MSTPRHQGIPPNAMPAAPAAVGAWRRGRCRAVKQFAGDPPLVGLEPVHDERRHDEDQQGQMFLGMQVGFHFGNPPVPDVFVGPASRHQ